jgi:Caspase domain
MTKVGPLLCLGWSLLTGDALAAKRVAVVVGVSKVTALPDNLQTTRARDDARALARYLEDSGGYSVQLMLDEVVTRDGLTRMLSETLLRQVQPGDTVLVAFIGNGIGADIGEPRLLLPDSRLDDLASSSIDLQQLGADLSRDYSGVNLVVITDAAHQGQSDGMALLGPSAKSWPTMRGSVFLLSAAAPNEVAPDGMFIPLLVAGLEGAADANSDGQVTTSELHRHLLVSVAAATGDTVHPAEAGTYDPNLVIGTNKVGFGQTPTPTPTAGSDRRYGGPLSFGLMGAGVAAGGVSLFAYVKGASVCEAQGTWPDACPTTGSYPILRKVNLASGVAGGVLVVAGVGLGFVPLQGGGLVAVDGRF